ncbi:MAG TPA: HAMP domain-containing sensor histidine kinase [Micromonosporaceae bacterium]|nr:HAMP domain-containing sensor histidine kinase [Micromonosporaceae bacterium]
MSGVRAQLNLLVAATTSLVLIAFLVPLGLLLSRAAEERAVAAATQRAQAAAALVAIGQSPSETGGALEPLVTVFYADGRIAGAPAERTPSIELASRGNAFTAQVPARDGEPGGVEVLVPVEGLPEGTAVVRAFAPEPLLRQGVLRTQIILGLLGVALFAVGLALADRLGRRLVRSVTALAATADRLAAGDLTARVEPSSIPELRRVGVELNRLAARIQELLAAEREEVADLAHRLRTPVTALRLNVDSVADPRHRARLASDVDALSRIVDEVIRTARRPVREGAGAASDLVAVVAERVRFWSALADDGGRTLEYVAAAGSVPVRASAEDLATAVDALLENVFAHTSDGTGLRVTVEATPDGGRLTVEDAGPGFGSYAGRGASTAGSTGLGLDIARRTAEAGGGTMRLGRSPLGGALVELTFGFPTA